MSFGEILSDSYLSGVVFRALGVGVAVSLCAALLGVVLVLKRFSMIGDGLSHVGFGALALAAVLGVAGEYTMEFSLPVVGIAAFLMLYLTEKGKLKGDSATAVISSSAMAIGVILYHVTGGMTADACSSLFGSASVITLSKKEAVLALCLSAVVLALFFAMYRRIFAVTFDQPFARATCGVGTGYRLALSLLIAVTVVVGMKMMGAVMISALIIFPALTAMRLCKSFRGVVLVAALFAVVCFGVGFVLACLWGLPTGPCVVVVNLVALLGASLVGKK